jgi:threonine synthase
VAGIKKLVAAGKIRADENVIAVLTGHMLKDTDYVSQYHHGTLALDTGAQQGSSPQPIHGAFANTPARVAANKSAILSAMEKRR